MPSGTNSFYQWNPNKNEQETDVAFEADSMRANGAPSGPSIFGTLLANKVLYQLSTMATALGQAIADAGNNASDAVLANLVAAIEATWANLNGNSTQAFNAANGASGKQVINISQFVLGGSHLIIPGGFVLNWGEIGCYGGGYANVVNFEYSFPIGTFFGMATGANLNSVSGNIALVNNSIANVYANTPNYGPYSIFWAVAGH